METASAWYVQVVPFSKGRSRRDCVFRFVRRGHGWYSIRRPNYVRKVFRNGDLCCIWLHRNKRSLRFHRRIRHPKSSVPVGFVQWYVLKHVVRCSEKVHSVLPLLYDSGSGNIEQPPLVPTLPDVLSWQSCLLRHRHHVPDDLHR